MRILRLAWLIALACLVKSGCAQSTWVSESREDTLVFAHLTDLHCARRSKNPPARFFLDIHTKDFVRSFEILERAVDEINRMEQVDFVVITGDLTNHGNDLDSLRKVKVILDELRVPYLPVIGDHDRPRVFSKVFPEPLNRSLEIKGWRLVIADASSGRLKPDTLEWLAKELDRHGDTRTLLFMHRPLLMSGLEEGLAKRFYNVRINLENSEEALRAIKARPWVKGVFAGHCHMNTVRRRGGCLFVTTPSLIEKGRFYRVVRASKKGIQEELRGVSLSCPVKKR